jgi:hypothetical protein
MLISDHLIVLDGYYGSSVMAKLKSFSLSAVSSSLEVFQMLEDTNYKILGSLSKQNSCHCLKVLEVHWIVGIRRRMKVGCDTIHQQGVEK